MAEISAGKAKLSDKANVASFDEVGRLSSQFNMVLDRLRSIFANVKATSSRAALHAFALDEKTSQADTAMDGLRQTVAMAGDAARGQTAEVGESRRVIGAMADAFVQVAEQVSTQAGFVEESSASISEIAANIGSVSRMTDQADGLAKETQ